MGAESFRQKAEGATAAIAFRDAVRTAQYECGYGGYTGTIAEKDSFLVIDVPAGQDPRVFAESLMREDDERIQDKWGPAGCVALGPNEWLFFGWASC